MSLTDDTTKNHTDKSHTDIKSLRNKNDKHPEIKLIRQEYNNVVRRYRQDIRFWIMVTRFTNKTWAENQLFRKNNPAAICVYGSPKPVATDIMRDGIMFILELNIETNQILGIGMIKNHLTHTRYQIYEDDNYNRFVYAGNQRIDSSDFTEEESVIMGFFEATCFTGKRHLKRGVGITTYPVDIICRCQSKMNLVLFIRNMFRVRMGMEKIGK